MTVITVGAAQAEAEISAEAGERQIPIQARPIRRRPQIRTIRDRALQALMGIASL